MYLQQVKNIMTAKGVRRADIAKMAGVSRAAVSKWFKSPEGEANVETRTLIKLAESLKIPPEYFLKKSEDISSFETKFLWDHIYPSMEEFVLALTRNHLPAIARLVQVLGFHSAEKICGISVLKLFPKYKKFIKPARLKELEILWPLYHPLK